MNFEEFNLHDTIMSGINESGYAMPTPIQQQAIPHILEGKDVIGLAQTGTGKTAAFVLPGLQRLISNADGNVRILVISPTRELAEQTHQTFTLLGKHTGLRSIAVYGGVGISPQTQGLRNGVDIVVACPGRLLDHLWQGNIDLSHLDILVIDEADRMLDMGFLPDVRNILRCIMNNPQTLLFSATMPADIRKLVKEILHEPFTIQIGLAKPASTVAHSLYPVGNERKTALLKELLKNIETDSVLIFTRTKYRTDRVARELRHSGFRVAALQGDMSQYERQEAMDRFRDGRVKILVATDIAARGIDILTISHVINYDMPDSIDSYTHRIGRTGRIGHSGEAFTFVTVDDAAMVRDIERLLNTEIERRTLPGFNDNIPEYKTTSNNHKINERPVKKRRYHRRSSPSSSNSSPRPADRHRSHPKATATS